MDDPDCPKPSTSGTPTRKTPNSPGILVRHKSVQWADWELKDVMEFGSCHDKKKLIDDGTQVEEQELCDGGGGVSLADTLVQTSVEISSLVSQTSSRSRSASETTCTSVLTMEENEERQAALSDLITHLEDTAALLRDYLQPPKVESQVADFTSYEQTIFLLKYLLVLVSFIQVILNMLLVCFATVVLSRQMLKYKVEGKFMAQTYLATVMTFAGLYFIIYRFQPESWEFGSIDKMEDNIAITQYIRMLYLSVSAATLCGAANIQPRYWYVTLILCCQSLINFVYFASILAQTIGNYHSYTVQVVRRRSSSASRSRFKI